MKPPALANWLLTRLVPASEVETIAGDLHEQFVKGRSSFWYWRQVLTTIVVHGTQDVRRSKLMTAVAVALGWIAMLAFSAVVNNIAILLRLSRDSAVVGLLLACVTGAVGGYVVVRLCRRFSMVLPLVVTMWLWTLVWFTLTVVGITGLRIRRPSDLAISVAVAFVLVPIGILLGGVSAAPRRQIS